MSLREQIRAKWNSLRRKRADGELDGELCFHLEAQIAENLRRGLPRAEAERIARVQLGGEQQVKEAAREMRFATWLEIFWQDIRFGARMLAKSPAFTAVAVITLALGIGANTAMFSVVYGVLLKPLPFERPQELVRVRESNPTRGFPDFSVTPPAFVDWRQMNRSFVDLAATYDTAFNRTGAGQPEHLEGMRVSASLFHLLGVQPLAGRLFVTEEEEIGKHFVALISESYWSRHFGGDPKAVGSTILLDGQAHTIIGVVPAVQAFPRSNTDVWAPLAFDPRQLAEAARGGHYLNVVGRLKPGVSREQSEADLKNIAAQLEKLHPKAQGWTVRTEGLHESAVGRVQTPLLVLLGAVAFVLLIACANVANLMLVRGAARQRELAIQSALGATRGRLARRLLTESVLLAMAGAAAGIALAGWGVGLLRTLGPRVNLPRASSIHVDGTVLLFTTTIAVLTGLLFGAMPAAHFSRARISDALQEGARALGGRARQRWRGGLVLVQMSLALVLLVGAGLLLRSFAALREVNPGFDPNGVLTMRIALSDARRYPTQAAVTQFYAATLQKLRAAPGVETAAMATLLPLSDDDEYRSVRKAGEEPRTDAPSVSYSIVTPDYFRAMRIPMVRGRAFTESDTASTPRVAIINQTFAQRFYPGQNPLGQRIFFGSDPVPREIVGVAGDVKRDGLDRAVDDQGYEPALQEPPDMMTLVLRTAGDPGSLTTAAQQAVWSVDPDLPISGVATLRDMVSGTLTEPVFRMTLLGTFAAMALALAAVGLYGVMAYGVQQRTQEIGLRMALGASPGEILGMVLRQSAQLIVVGIGIGLAGALALTKFLASLLFTVTPHDPATFLLFPLVLAAVAMLASWIPAWRASRVDPLVALRHQ